MPITILRPQPASHRPISSLVDSNNNSDSDDSDGGVDIHGDVAMRAPKRRRASEDDNDHHDADEILTPGTVITSNPQWMR